MVLREPAHHQTSRDGECDADVAGEDSPTSSAIAAAAAAAVAAGGYGLPSRASSEGLPIRSGSKEHSSATSAVPVPSERSHGGGTLVANSALPGSNGRFGGQIETDPLLPPASTGGVGEEASVVIPADASLTDGLRALLVHHLKLSVDADSVSLSASQAELLEHHMARLASYATKIVHTLAYSTRFLSKHRLEEDAGENDGPPPEPSNGRAGAKAAAQQHLAEESPYLSSIGGGRRPAPPTPAPAAAEPKPQRKALKLNDDEILSLYRSAQMEASIEADWRGISGAARNAPGAERSGVSHHHDHAGAVSTSTTPTGDSALGAKEHDQEYLRMVSRAMRQPGRSPRAVTAEILATRNTVCCAAPRVDAMRGGSLQQPPGAASPPYPPDFAGSLR